MWELDYLRTMLQDVSREQGLVNRVNTSPVNPWTTCFGIQHETYHVVAVGAISGEAERKRPSNGDGDA